MFDNWNIRDVATVYSSILATFAATWAVVQMIEKWRARDRVELRFSYRGRFADGKGVMWPVLEIRNAGPTKIYIQGVEVTIPEHPISLQRCGPFPGELEAYRTALIPQLPLDNLIARPRGLVVIDGRNRRWKMKRAQLREAIDKARAYKAEHERLGFTLEQVLEIAFKDSDKFYTID